jgi:hypothetical protein
MANVLDRNFDFATNGTVTAAGLHNLIDDTNIYAGLISTQEETTSVGTGDLLLIANSSSIGSPQIAANRTTVYNLFDDALTSGTYANAQLSGSLTYGTATGNRTISTSAVITNGTIGNATLGTTTGTLATITNLTAGTTTSTAANITSGTVQTLTASTGTIGTFNSTTGTIATLNSTTGTIGNLSTTLAGDFTISQGTATLATSGATAGTYGSVTAIPFITVDAKGRITSATTGTFSSTPPAGSVTFNTLSTSTAEADNVAKRTAKVWVNFNGTTNTGGNCTIRDDFNVSTVADNGTGLYTVNFTTAMADTNYAVCFGATNYNDRGATMLISSATSATSVAPATQATSSIQISNREYNGTNFVSIDAVVATMTIFGS